MPIPDELPVLAVGSHSAGSGFMCVMNALSYMAGDKKISDYPTCVDPMLARVAQVYNDVICGHQKSILVPSGLPPLKWSAFHQGTEVKQLCSACSHQVWLYGAKLMGTAEPWRVWATPEAVRAHQWAAYAGVLRDALQRWDVSGSRVPGQLLSRTADVLLKPELHETERLAETIQIAYHNPQGKWSGIDKAQRDILTSVVMCATDRARALHMPDLVMLATGAEDAGQALAAAVADTTSRIATGSSMKMNRLQLRAWAANTLLDWSRRTGHVLTDPEFTPARMQALTLVGA